MMIPVPSNNADVLARFHAVSTTITCGAGGGRAMCGDPSLLLCTYPTRTRASAWRSTAR